MIDDDMHIHSKRQSIINIQKQTKEEGLSGLTVYLVLLQVSVEAVYSKKS
jgi:hypothetical protein